MKKTKKILEWITKVEYAIMIVAFVLMVLCYFTSVVNRNFIKASMPWAEELALYSMTFMALLGTEVGLRDGTQVAVTAVIEKLHGMTRKVRTPNQDEAADCQYYLRDYQGKLAVFLPDKQTPEIVFDVYLSTLPAYDRGQLQLGVPVQDYEELVKRIEDYIS